MAFCNMAANLTREATTNVVVTLTHYISDSYLLLERSGEQELIYTWPYKLVISNLQVLFEMVQIAVY